MTMPTETEFMLMDEAPIIGDPVLQRIRDWYLLNQVTGQGMASCSCETPATEDPVDADRVLKTRLKNRAASSIFPNTYNGGCEIVEQGDMVKVRLTHPDVVLNTDTLKAWTGEVKSWLGGSLFTTADVPKGVELRIPKRLFEERKDQA